MIEWLKARPWIALVAVLLAQSFIFCLAQRDLATSDPLWYATNAHALASDPLGFVRAGSTHPFAMRIGVIGPVAVLYRLAGVSIVTTNALCLVSLLAIIAVIYAAMETPQQKWLAMAILVGCEPFIVRDAAMLNPDLPCAAWMALATLALARRRLYLAVAASFCAFLTKETAVWCAVPWVYVAIADRRDGWRAWRGPAALAAVLVAGYVAACAAIWGDPLARFHGVEALEHSWDLARQASSVWLARMTTEPLHLLWMFFGALLVPIALAVRLVRGRDRVWVVAAGAFVALFWFGSSTLRHYSPLPVVARMAFPLVPPLLVIAALALGELAQRHVRWVYAGVALLVVAPQLLKLRHVRGVRDESAVFAKVVADAKATSGRYTLVCGDPRCPSVTTFYFGFEVPANVRVVEELPAAGDGRVAVIVNRPRAAEYHRDLEARAAAAGVPRSLVTPTTVLFDSYLRGQAPTGSIRGGGAD